MTNHSAVHVLVVGHVQGVFYRATTRSVAHEMGIRGWVRNLPEGHVEVVAIGEEETLRAFLHYCQEGPRDAKVKEIHTKWISPEEYGEIPLGFEIR
jgi:acylphosphatase